jgi:hydrogenase expression/formation protein HypE
MDFMNDETKSTASGFTCPIPVSDYPAITLPHGGGGKLTRQLIDTLFLPAFRNPMLEPLHDGAVVSAGGARLAFTTDGYVVRPLFFPGGDIGSLAVNGTVNDLAMCGARPLFLSAGFILEEGLPMETLHRIVLSMQKAAREAGVSLVTGDTKVVERGKGDGMYITTAGIGLIAHGRSIGPSALRPGDAVLLSGDIGRHGVAILAQREGLTFETTIESDCANLAPAALALLDAGLDVHCLRDLTRGGLATALVEIAESRHARISVEENAIPVPGEVGGACEILGLDSLYVANEGRFIAFLPESQVDQALQILRSHPVGASACRIGSVADDEAGRAEITSVLGVARLLTLFSGEQLPRIC